MFKLKAWEGEGLTGSWLVTLKIDGVCTIVSGGVALSKRGKPLYNIPDVPDGIYEAFRDDWNTSVSLVRTKNGGTPLSLRDMYRVDVIEDDSPLMYLEPTAVEYTRGIFFLPKVLENPTGYTVESLLKKILKLGYEGLVLVPLGPDGKPDWRAKRYKVKPHVTVDVRITGYLEGTGKYVGMLGAFATEHGDVGIGFSDDQRASFWERREQFIGSIIECKAMGWTREGKMRHPRFVRERFDKSEENLEGYGKEV